MDCRYVIVLKKSIEQSLFCISTLLHWAFDTYFVYIKWFRAILKRRCLRQIFMVLLFSGSSQHIFVNVIFRQDKSCEEKFIQKIPFICKMFKMLKISTYVFIISTDQTKIPEKTRTFLYVSDFFFLNWIENINYGFLLLDRKGMFIAFPDTIK